MPLWDTGFGTGAQAAPGILDAYNKGQKQEIELQNARTEQSKINMAMLEASLTQPDRLAQSIATARQAIQSVDPNRIRRAGGFENQQKLEDQTDAKLTEEEMRQVFVSRFGEGVLPALGNAEKMKDYFKDQKIKPGTPAFQDLVDEAVDGYKKLKSGIQRSPQGFSMEDLAPIRSVRGADGSLSVEAVPQPAAPQQIVVPQTQPVEVAPTLIEGQQLPPVNMYDPSVRAGQLNLALQQEPLTNAELELAKGQQSANFMAQKLMSEHLLKKDLATADIAARAKEGSENRQVEMDKANKDLAAKLIGIKMQSERPRGGGRGGDTFQQKIDLKTIGEIDRYKKWLTVLGGPQNEGARKMARQKINSFGTPEARARAEQDLAAYIAPAAQAVPAGGIARKQYNPKLNKTRITYSDGRVEEVDGKK